MAVIVLSPADLVNVQSRWDDLLRHSTTLEARLFLSPEWVLTWWRHLGQGQPLFLVVIEKMQWLAMAPLFVVPSPLFPFARLVRFIGNGNADYGDFLVRRGREEAAVPLWRWLFDHRDLWDVIALHELPENSIALQGLRSLSLPDGVQVQVEEGEPCHRIPLSTDASTNGQSWRKRATKALQQQLRRRERQIERTFQVRFGCVTDERELPTVLAQLFALHRLRWGRLGQPTPTQKGCHRPKMTMHKAMNPCPAVTPSLNEPVSPKVNAAPPTPISKLPTSATSDRSHRTG